MEFDRILRALKALYDDVDKSTLNDSEKNAMRLLIERLSTYCTNKHEEIVNSLAVEAISNRLNAFFGEMVDYIVSINDTLKGKNNVFQIVNIIYKEINYDQKLERFKRKRLI